MLINGLHHVSMKCASEAEIAQVRRFYCDTLGLRIVHTWPDGIMIDTGSGLLEVFTNGDGTHTTGAIRHLAFSVDDAAACADAVRLAGFEVFLGPKEIDTPYHAVIAFCFGPLGEQVEFFQLLTD